MAPAGDYSSEQAPEMFGLGASSDGEFQRDLSNCWPALFGGSEAQLHHTP
ncbi:unnamed protein product [Soboliphyme baturini]|uniref:Uncharacterized protein n=1 Tax=Soboliphyme baturini TaxID=241478 RepID=A0A183IHM2_9BILA|nr:unnamed protein product [Soboliphyme baturini]